jgi:hypothetical protein
VWSLRQGGVGPATLAWLTWLGWTWRDWVWRGGGATVTCGIARWRWAAVGVDPATPRQGKARHGQALAWRGAIRRVSGTCGTCEIGPCSGWVCPGDSGLAWWGRRCERGLGIGGSSSEPSAVGLSTLAGLRLALPRPVWRAVWASPVRSMSSGCAGLRVVLVTPASLGRAGMTWLLLGSPWHAIHGWAWSGARPGPGRFFGPGMPGRGDSRHPGTMALVQGCEGL